MLYYAIPYQKPAKKILTAHASSSVHDKKQPNIFVSCFGPSSSEQLLE